MGNAMETLKTISMFDMDKDFGDQESKERLSDLFRQLIMNDEPEAQEFFNRFSNEIDSIIRDMGVDVPEPAEEPAEDEVIDEPVDDEAEPEVEEEPAGKAKIPDELLGAGYEYIRPIIEQANHFIYD